MPKATTEQLHAEYERLMRLYWQIGDKLQEISARLKQAGEEPKTMVPPDKRRRVRR